MTNRTLLRLLPFLAIAGCAMDVADTEDEITDVQSELGIPATRWQPFRGNCASRLSGNQWTGGDGITVLYSPEPPACMVTSAVTIPVGWRIQGMEARVTADVSNEYSQKPGKLAASLLVNGVRAATTTQSVLGLRTYTLRGNVAAASFCKGRPVTLPIGFSATISDATHKQLWSTDFTLTGLTRCP